MNEEKLIEILKNNDVRISNKGNICLNDFVKNIIKSKNPKLYVNKLNNYDKIEIKGKCYINSNDCANILKNSNFRRCKDIYTKIYINDDNKESIIDVENEIFQFEGHKFTAFFIDKGEGDWDVFLKASEVAKHLGYVDDKQAVRDHVDPNNKIDLEKFKELFPKFVDKIPKCDKKTIFINKKGISQLVLKSRKPASIQMAKLLNLNVETKYLKKETEIIDQLNIFCQHLNLETKHSYTIRDKNNNYFVDYYLPDLKLVIEIDEHNHSDRDPVYEKMREKCIKNKLKCKFIRVNPDDTNFSITGLLAAITKVLLKAKIYAT